MPACAVQLLLSLANAGKNPESVIRGRGEFGMSSPFFFFFFFPNFGLRKRGEGRHDLLFRLRIGQSSCLPSFTTPGEHMIFINYDILTRSR